MLTTQPLKFVRNVAVLNNTLASVAYSDINLIEELIVNCFLILMFSYKIYFILLLAFSVASSQSKGQVKLQLVPDQELLGLTNYT